MPDTEPPPPPATVPSTPYRVLARTYRPSRFSDLVGQDALVRTLTNAIRSGRLHHAFILTGVRGVGKTTTARLIARGLNCIGADGTGGPTAEPCGVCTNCTAIAQDRHVDVLEMDAASHTGIDTIRELIDSARYAPGQARFKIYIIDEVHMLSKAAFNGLLKTLEEPPAHVKFIFATTEIRKVPVTILSRCQRFDLRRIEMDVLVGLFEGILEKEGITAEAEAIRLIARAADGSARDGLSLLDQAIAQNAGGPIEADSVTDMLGLSDRNRVLDLLEHALHGRGGDALALLESLHEAGTDPAVLLQDLLDFTHVLTRLRLLPSLADDPALPQIERQRCAALAQRLTMPGLTRCWQLLLKGVEELQMAPDGRAALEMVIIRLVHTAGLPTPGDILKRLQRGEFTPPPAAKEGPPAGGGGETGGSIHPRAAITIVEGGGAYPIAQAASAVTQDVPADFDALVALFERPGADAVAQAHLINDVHLVRFGPGLLEIRPRDQAPTDLASRLDRALRAATGHRWMVSISNETGAPTLAQQRQAEDSRVLAEARANPIVQAVFEAFPQASLEAVHDLSSGDLDPSLAGGEAGFGDTSDEDFESFVED